MTNNTNIVIEECQPEVGKTYMVQYVGNVFTVKVTSIYFLEPQHARIVEGINLANNSRITLLASHLNAAIFYRGTK